MNFTLHHHDLVNVSGVNGTFHGRHESCQKINKWHDVFCSSLKVIFVFRSHPKLLGRVNVLWKFFRGSPLQSGLWYTRTGVVCRGWGGRERRLKPVWNVNCIAGEIVAANAGASASQRAIEECRQLWHLNLHDFMYQNVINVCYHKGTSSFYMYKFCSLLFNRRKKKNTYQMISEFIYNFRFQHLDKKQSVLPQSFYFMWTGECSSYSNTAVAAAFPARHTTKKYWKYVSSVAGWFQIDIGSRNRVLSLPFFFF